jgi:hypothetical protein
MIFLIPRWLGADFERRRCEKRVFLTADCALLCSRPFYEFGNEPGNSDAHSFEAPMRSGIEMDSRRF